MFQHAVRQFLARRDFLRLGIGSTLGVAGAALLQHPTATQPAPATGDMAAMQMPGSAAAPATAGHAHGNAMLVGSVDPVANGFDPRGTAPRTPLAIAYLIALGIGLHNLGEGLAIAAAFGLGGAALGAFLVLGFTLHNITEGVGIVSPLTRRRPPLWHFALLAVLAGGPAILGVWLGGFVFNPVAATIFLAIGVGAIVQVIWEVGKLVVNDAVRHQASALTWANLGSVTLGLAVMYFTAFLVKF